MTKTNALRLLEQSGVGYESFEYSIDDDKIDAQSVAAKIGRAPEEVFKTLVAQGAAQNYFVFILPGSGELDLKKAARAAGEKSMELIPLKKLLPLTGYVHGGCSPVGMKKLFPTYLDETAILYETICVSGGRVGLNVSVNPEALAALVNASFADLQKE